ncbi:hypothetical protein CUJ83_05730 [Methanocella sp. CWC-04]|uniref:Glycoside hydrolase family 42 N-terminal domain-containing protein n=1 Tax=Methanooceanicella nereidis TaxID=2052831 RepID=A0AAP2RBK3_9EURY|nr:hypothetical protein [Methanocella sp. CWC-04]MCD1294499.1 hypothetical protein [Methanocella sp. CWC-04]
MIFKDSKITAILLIVIILAGFVTAGGCLMAEQEKTLTGMPPEQNDIISKVYNGSIIIGIEYAMPGMAETFSELGVDAVKYYPDEISWERMQETRYSPIDFRRMDRFVREYQDAGFKDLVITLKTEGSWAIKDPIRNYSPKPENLDDYEKWVRAIVERYDKDGTDDMPGLKEPVMLYEIGSQFSDLEPEPAYDYIIMLERAYRAAHNASDDVIVTHAAFIVTTAFKDDPGPGDYEASFDSVDKRIMSHSLSDIRKVLDRPDIFDAVNFHAVGDPYEIEKTVKWLDYEMDQRGYKKPVIIGDTAATPFIAWGPATVWDKEPSRMGILIPPATEEDRYRLSKFFQRLIEGDKDTRNWTQSFVASDMVKKVIVASEQDVMLIDTALMEDLTLFKSELYRGASGISPWGGMALTNISTSDQERTIIELRPLFYALKQLNKNIGDYTSVERVPTSDDSIRLYKYNKDNRTVWVAWYEPGKLLLPGDEVAPQQLQVVTNATSIVVERSIVRKGQVWPDMDIVKPENGIAVIDIDTEPAYIRADGTVYSIEDVKKINSEPATTSSALVLGS